MLRKIIDHLKITNNIKEILFIHKIKVFKIKEFLILGLIILSQIIPCKEVQILINIQEINTLE